VIHARDTRRQFLTRVGRAGGLGAAFVSMRSLGLLADSEPVAIDAPPDTGVGTKVVVLGGGIGGLVTAYELRRAGFDCTLLEARRRPGGRTWTLRRDAAVELNDGSVQTVAWTAENYLNAGPARIPAVHTAMTSYCRELGVAMEVEINTSRSSLFVNGAAFGGKAIEQRRAVNDTRGHVAELLAKAVSAHALDAEVTAEDRERMIAFLKTYGDLDANLAYTGSPRAGVAHPAGAGDAAEQTREPLPMHALLDANFWRGMMFEEELAMQATMMQPVGGMDRVPYAFASALGSTIEYGAAVTAIRKTDRGVRVAYVQDGTPRQIEAPYCVCTVPVPVLRSIAHDFSPVVAKALSDTVYADAYKIAWESRRFWETDYNIYGGLSWIVGGPIEVVWYPSAGLNRPTGIIVSGYGRESTPPFAQLPDRNAKIAASRAAIEQLHPGCGHELTRPMYVPWGKMPYSLGSWVSVGGDAARGRPDFYATDGPYAAFCRPDDRIYFAGDHCSRLVGWQEGAALSARRAVNLIVERVRAEKSTGAMVSGGGKGV
jgi:monoamine oxidase